MFIKWKNRWACGLLATLLLLMAACSDNVPQQPRADLSGELPSIERPTAEKVEQVIRKFLERKEASSVRLWVSANGELVAKMTGTTENDRWTFAGEHAEQPFIQLSGQEEDVQWKTKETSGAFEQTTKGLFSPHDHLKQARQSFKDVRLLPGNRFESSWTPVQVSLTDEKVQQVVKGILGEQFATPAVREKVAQRMDVRYTLWYNKQNLDLQQIKVDLYSIKGQTAKKIQSLIYLFGESAL